MSRRILLLFAFIYYIVHVRGNTNGKVKVNLKHVQDCVSPNPPFPKEPIISTVYNLQNDKGKALISGQNTVIAEVPFLNFSYTVYNTDEFGKRNLLRFMDNISCHNWQGKAYLTVGRFRYHKKDCRIRKGVYEYSNIDINAVLHSLPNYHAAGTMSYIMQLVHNNTTFICNEMLLSIS